MLPITWKNLEKRGLSIPGPYNDELTRLAIADWCCHLQAKGGGKWSHYAVQQAIGRGRTQGLDAGQFREVIRANLIADNSKLFFDAQVRLDQQHAAAQCFERDRPRARS